MKVRIRSLALSAAVGAAGLTGLNHLLAEGPPAKPAEPAKADAKAEPKAPIAFTDEVVATRTAVTPKALTDSAKKGLAYLLKNQQEDGGWNQGGGWRTSLVQNAGGRVEGKEVEDPSDIGNTSIALLALIRAGHTPAEGEHKEAVKKGLRFVCARVEKADKADLYVTDVRNTQLQSKIGTYIDTFLANLVLAELKGKAGDDEKRLIACLDKTMNKIVKNQTAEGQFANNGGWAPVLSVCVANKGIARARQNGVQVDGTYLARAAEQSRLAVAGLPVGAVAGTGALGRVEPASSAITKVAPAVPAGPVSGPLPLDPKGPPAMPEAVAALPRTGVTATKGAGTLTLSSGAGGLAGGDAGVRLYSIAQGVGNLQDAVNAGKPDAERAKKVVADPKAPPAAKEAAQKQVYAFEALEKSNGDAQAQLGAQLKNEQFVAGFGSNGGEEFLSFLNISETLVVKGGKEWEEWDGKMRKGMEKAQDKDGSWAGNHCITGKTFCTAGALLVMLADRTPFPVDALEKKAEKKPEGSQPLPTPGAEKK